jgi:CO/xanthine dehydrogenase FAD-binding subunit
MKDFEYFTPKTVKEAISLLAKLKGEGKVFAYQGFVRAGLHELR